MELPKVQEVIEVLLLIFIQVLSIFHPLSAFKDCLDCGAHNPLLLYKYLCGK